MRQRQTFNRLQVPPYFELTKFVDPGGIYHRDGVRRMRLDGWTFIVFVVGVLVGVVAMMAFG